MKINKIKMTDDPSDDNHEELKSDMPDERVLDAYFKNRPPADKLSDDVSAMTTIEIIDEIDDIYPLSIAQVAQYMFAHGYKLFDYDDDRLRWLIQKKR